MAGRRPIRREPGQPLPKEWTYRYPDPRDCCTYCEVLTSQGVRHDLCPVETNTTAPGRKDNKTWTCKCAEKGHQP